MEDQERQLILSKLPDYLKQQIPALQELNVPIDDILNILRSRKTDNWEEKFIELAEQANMSPSQVATQCGVSWNTVIRKARENAKKGDNILQEAVDNLKRAFAEYAMFHPEKYGGNSATLIFMVKALAGWTEAAINDFGTPNDQELEKVLEARKALIKEVETLDKDFQTGKLRLAQ